MSKVRERETAVDARASAVHTREVAAAQREDAIRERERNVSEREEALRIQKMAVEEHAEGLEQRAAHLREANEYLMLAAISAQTMSEISEIDKLEMTLNLPSAAAEGEIGESEKREEQNNRREAAVRLRDELMARLDVVTAGLRDLAGADESEDRVVQLLQANEQLVIASLRAQTMKEEAESAARKKDDYLEMLSNQLRGPLPPIRNAIAILHRIQAADPRLPWIHRAITRQLKQMTRLLDDLVDMTHESSGDMPLRKRAVAVGEFIQEAVEACRPLFGARGQQLEVEMRGRGAYTHGDPVRLAQVVANLLANAARHSQEGGVVALKAVQRDSDVQVRVIEDGGASTPEQPVFDLPTPDYSAGDASQGGLGIWLALVRNLVEMHNGTFDYNPARADHGGEAVVTLPLL